jgi:hypothetical protein
MAPFVAGGFHGDPRLRAIYCCDRVSFEGSGISILGNAIRSRGHESRWQVDVDELALFVNAISRPDTDQR